MNTETLIHGGADINVFDPSTYRFSIEDVGRSLANKCRWVGQTSAFYSVAEHSIMVSDKVSAPLKLWALLHDAGEAFLADVPAPHKDCVWFHVPDVRGVIQKRPFVDVENDLLAYTLRLAGLPVVPMPDEVSAADLMIRAWERRALVECDGLLFQPMPPKHAKAAWLSRYYSLREQAIESYWIDHPTPAFPLARALTG